MIGGEGAEAAEKTSLFVIFPISFPPNLMGMLTGFAGTKQLRRVADFGTSLLESLTVVNRNIVDRM
jgi:hypothetical protein